MAMPVRSKFEAVLQWEAEQASQAAALLARSALPERAKREALAKAAAAEVLLGLARAEWDREAAAARALKR